MKIIDITKVPFKSVLQSIENIEERNKKFDSLSDEDKRKEIAWDALQLILVEEVVKASRGYYWSDNLHQKAKGNSKTFQKALVDLEGIEECKVCARGAVMLSQIRLGNKVSPNLGPLTYARGDERNLNGFHIVQMKAMEDRFERSCNPFEYNTDESLVNILLEVVVTGNFDSRYHINYIERFQPKTNIQKVPYTSVLQPITDIEERNKAFDALTNEQKRREIAYDSLKLILGEGNVTGSSGFYWTDQLSGLKFIKANDKKKMRFLTPEEFQQTLQNVPKCSVCARGAVMLSQIRLGNKISPEDDECMSGSIENLNGFSMVSMENMESEYEYSDFEHPYYSRTTEKLVNILLNVIAYGRFKTSTKTDYIKKYGIEL